MPGAQAPYDRAIQAAVGARAADRHGHQRYIAMATLTLTKAGRRQDRIRAAIRELPLKPYVTIGIFAPEPGAVVEREAAKFRENVDVLERLLAILASLRAAAGRANADSGISQLLAEKAALDEEVSLLSKLMPAQAGRPAADFERLLHSRDGRWTMSGVELSR